ncbi:mannose-6-phosphate isomerase [Mucilaginibacter hurinus]|uniref:Mannose-6-phosphate isomerase n=1 Tax=Mucilaginibacter hurinus TaxID=2201324 RepID=A0A367GLA3_9SPHI|nr:class I mannose-6-phosphate isomerase [Mucilaginibacter hurinus]RCH54257.1 mannose-6-phosphate isomerase [Mucilaginibacter hurinus]
MKTANYQKFPFVQVEKENKSCVTGWEAIATKINDDIASGKKLIAIETYQGVLNDEIIAGLKDAVKHDLWIDAAEAFKSEDEILKMTYPDVTDDRIFGYITRLNISDYLDNAKVEAAQQKAKTAGSGVVVVYGVGASLVLPNFDLLVYADMARWEIQLRMRKKLVNNIGITNNHEEFSIQYKRGFFVDWRAADRLKKQLFKKIDYILDTNAAGSPKMITGAAAQKGYQISVSRPFRVVPFFDPGPWGGQWMKEVMDLDRSAVNFAWGFDCVPEENSLLLRFGDVDVELPSINLVFFETNNLLGPKVHSRFGDEFPIRFDFLDTVEGGNLSFQVHPLTEYIQEKFGMHYTQDESYYYLDIDGSADVYLGLQENVDPEEMIADLRAAQNGEKHFDDEKYVKRWPMKKHDHISIPAGTVHCSGTGGMVLEISATPYIFTFKLWDWGRLGLDGKPRPINIEHGKNVIQWDRTASWVEKHALNLVEPLGEGDGWREERTGLNELQFIETRRHWFTGKVSHNTNGGVNVLNLVEGREAIVESPTNAFEPFVVHYAETFIVPAAVGEYTIRPYGESEGQECGTLKAYVRI